MDSGRGMQVHMGKIGMGFMVRQNIESGVWSFDVFGDGASNRFIKQIKTLGAT
jgi:hypothetical protein